MNKIILSLSFFFISYFTVAQTTAQDWNKTDCSGGDHNLFSYLDNYEVVVIEFGMGCGSCSSAADYLINTLKTKYDASHPGKVKFFYMDYWAGNDCAGYVQPMLNGYAFDAGFENCQPELSYYMTGSPMPAIVIAAGPMHSVIYEKNNFIAGSDTTNIRSEIDTALMMLAGPQCFCTDEEYIRLYPNPSEGNIDIRSTFDITSIMIYDIAGKEVFFLSPNAKIVNIGLGGTIAKGIYFAEITVEGHRQIEKFVVE